MVFTTRFAGGTRRPQRLRDRTRTASASPRRTPRPEPPDHLRQGRTLPTDPEEVARAPTPRQPPSPNCKPCSTPSSTHYNHRRPHRSLPHRATPATAYTARPKATPGDHATDTHYRVRHDRVDNTGSRHPARRRPPAPHRHRPNPRPNPRPPAHPRPRHPRHQRRHRRTPPRTHPRPHQRLPTHRRPQRPHTETSPEPNEGSGYSDVLRHHNGAPGQDSNLRHRL